MNSSPNNLFGGWGGGGGGGVGERELFTCPYPLKVHECPPRDQSPALRSGTQPMSYELILSNRQVNAKETSRRNYVNTLTPSASKRE